MTTDDRENRTAMQRELERLHARLDQLENSVREDRALRAELNELQNSRRQLADQAAHLVQQLGEARREANWFKQKLEEAEGSQAN
ncbi:MAG: hypothetical protein AAF196_00475 [Planctomycetota bacterium]